MSKNQRMLSQVLIFCVDQWSQCFEFLKFKSYKKTRWLPVGVRVFVNLSVVESIFICGEAQRSAESQLNQMLLYTNCLNA